MSEHRRPQRDDIVTPSARRSAIASVVIPAYNEETVLPGVLESLLRDAGDDELEIVVVANGCTDGTADAARRFGSRVRVVETSTASKPNALNLGDERTGCFPRVYLDADIPVDTEAVRRLAAVLGPGGALAASPTMRVDVAGRPWGVRAYYEVWMRLPYVTDAHLAGVIGMSREGRERFGPFPDLIADDLYVRGHFGPDERRRLDDCEYVVQAPWSLRSLVRVKTRSFAGGIELGRRYPDVAARGRGRGGVRSRLATLARDPRLWPALGCYTLVWCTARVRGWWHVRVHRGERWHRDDTTRGTPSEDRVSSRTSPTLPAD